MGKSLKGKRIRQWDFRKGRTGRYQAIIYIPGSPKPKILYDTKFGKTKEKNVIWEKSIITFWVIYDKAKNI